jgi:hypothetical protein
MMKKLLQGRELEENATLPKKVEVIAFTRPTKVAYIVPYQECNETHFILDAVFYEAYTRWGGAGTLIIPSDEAGFLYKEHEHLLKVYDPDFVCVYIDLEHELVEKINNLCLPVQLVKHQMSRVGSGGWKSYIPDWRRIVEPVSSLTTLNGIRRNPYEEHKLPIIVTQSTDISKERFISDNFGIKCQLYNNLNPVPDCFETLSLDIEVAHSGVRTGSYVVNSVAGMLEKIVEKKAITVARLATLYSDSIPRVKENKYLNGLNVFIGESCLDRISFWNMRVHVGIGMEVPGSLIIRKSLCADDKFMRALGNMLNNINSYGNPPTVLIRSLSVNKEELDNIKKNLQEHTYNFVVVPSDYANNIVPSIENVNDARHYQYYQHKDKNNFKLNEKHTEVVAQPPEHFLFAIPKLYPFYRGTWAVELSIERHNDYSRIANKNDVWKIPRKINASSSFTNNLGKISINNILVVIPSNKENRLIDDVGISKMSYNLCLPEDLDFFRRILAKEQFAAGDLRSDIPLCSYENIDVSDKGKNLRGVISMFDCLNQSYKYLTNRYSREILREHYDKEKFILFENINVNYQKNVELKKHIQDKLEMKPKEVKNYIRLSLKKLFSIWIRKKILYRVHEWSCSYCGHNNVKHFDKIKEKNKCDICQHVYFPPLDLQWHFNVTEFVINSLVERNGLSVLYMLGFLHECSRDSFYFLVETNLFENVSDKEPSGEIDILCVIDGKLHLIEVAKSSEGLCKEEIIKFIKKVDKIKPDIATIIFETSRSSTDKNQKRIMKYKNFLKEKLENKEYGCPRVDIHIASTDFPDFNDYPLYF